MRCEKTYSELSHLIYNDHNFVNFELSLVKVVMYLLIFIYSMNFLLKNEVLLKKTKNKN